MSFPRYEHYKDSGVEWLGEVPAHWVVRPLKRLAKLVTGMTPPTDDYDNYEDAGFPWVRPEDINETGNAISASKFLSQKGAAISRYVGNGAILICCIGTIGKVGFTSESVATNQQITAAEFIGHGKYFYYFAHAARNEMELAATGNVLKILNSERLGNIRFVHPPEAEQASIAAFLDHETTKLDALITEQRTLIDLLKEKRQAVISHAVTKGLDPRVPMKDSRVEWLGEVPAHWDVVRNKVVFMEIDERNVDGVGVLMTVSHITGVTPRSEKNVNMILAESLEGYKFAKTGDLVINTMWAWMGALGVSPCDGLFSPSYNVYRPRYQDRIHPGYYDLICRIPRHVTAMKANSSGVWESRSRLYPNVFLSMFVCVPPLSEQRAIAREVDRQVINFEQLISEAETGIDLLQERRSALISAAVTGKIDVRHIHQPEPA